MDSYILDSYARLSAAERAAAPRLILSPYAPQGGAYGYDNAAVYSANSAGAGAHPVWSFYASEGAIYSITSSSYVDPAGLLIFDDAGYAIADDDRSGPAGSDHATFVAPYSGIYYVDAAWVQGQSPAQQGVSLSILEDRSILALTVIRGSNHADSIDGTSGDDDLYGYAGADTLFGGRGDDYIDGGPGIDSAFYNGKRADYAVHTSGDRISVTALASTEGSDLLSNVERLDFADISVGLDQNGPSGEAYRLYQAAFDRAPDVKGLGYWIAQLDHGTSLRAVAGGFTESAEFHALYGVSVDHRDLVLQLYENVLHRVPDQSGVNYWVNILDTHKATLPEVLVSFSESQENFAQLVGVTSQGVAYIPHL